MTDTRYKIVFTGDVLPGHDLNTVKDNLAKLFKSDVNRINALFKGTNVDIKRDLSEAEAKQYFNALQKAGAQVKIEHDLSASLTLVETEDHPTAATQSGAAHDSQMTCPKCGHEQPKNSECSACGIIIEKYLARQAQVAQSTPAVAEQPTTPYAPPKSAVSENLPAVGTLKVFTTDGRIGRLRYLAWSLVMTLVFIPAIAIFAVALWAGDSSGILSIIAGVIGVAALVVVSIMIGVQRVHDIGWSGWMILLTFVPAIGTVFTLLMFLMPGSTEANRYGPPPPPNSTAVKVLASLWLVLIVGGLLLAILVPSYMAFLENSMK